MTQGQHKNNIQYVIVVVFMGLPTWKGAYCPRRVNPLSVRLFNHAWGQVTGRGLMPDLMDLTDLTERQAQSSKVKRRQPYGAIYWCTLDAE